MQRVLLALLVMLGIGWPAGDARGGPIAIADPLARLTPASIDFGTLPQGVRREVDVRLENAGSSLLTVNRIESDCGCTVAELPDSSLAPGESTTLHVTLLTHTFSGPILKHIFIDSNDPTSPRVTLSLHARVRPRVRINTTTLDFGAVAHGESPQRTVLLKAARTDSLRIRRVDVPDSLFTVTTDQHVEDDSLVCRVHVALRADAPAGPFREVGQIRTNQTVGGNVNLHLSGQVHGFFRLQPTAFSFGQLRQGTRRTRAVKLVGADRGRQRLLEASCTNPQLQISIATIEEGRLYEVQLTIPEEMPPGAIRAAVLLTTDDPAQPTIRLPVRGAVRRDRP